LDIQRHYLLTVFGYALRPRPSSSLNASHKYRFAVLVGGRSGKQAFHEDTSLPEGVAGLSWLFFACVGQLSDYGRGLIIAVIQGFPSTTNRRYVCGPRPQAVRRVSIKKLRLRNFPVGFSLTVTVGAERKFGRAYYDPLWRGGGRAAGRRLAKKKMQTWTFAFFSTSQPMSTDMGCSSPFEPFMLGFVNGA
jgi:hypothetical protein